MKKGFGLIEVIIAASIISLLIGALIGATNSFLKTSIKNTHTVKAGYLLEEGVEALKVIRDRGYTTYITTLSNNTSYYLYWNGTIWTATTSSSAIDTVFFRTIELGVVYRNGSSDISNSGSLDTGTRIATVTVSWIDNTSQATTSKTLVTYITNILSN
jgi:prepilin-type N-terminal cleavage/methylation domain-containing protein